MVKREEICVLSVHEKMGKSIKDGKLSFPSSSNNIIKIMKFSILGSSLILVSASQLVFAAPTMTSATPSSTSTYIPQVSPSFPSMAAATGVVTSYNTGPYNTSESLPTYQLSGYPEVWKTPDPSHAEVVAAAAKIDWSLVPDAPVRKQNKAGNFVPDSDGDKDPYCWWSDTNCLKPKIAIPEDFHSCPKKGDWGLSYDDGPFNLRDSSDKDAATENPYAEPALYNFLAKTNNQKANLFVSILIITDLHAFPYTHVLLLVVYWFQCRYLSCCC